MWVSVRTCKGLSADVTVELKRYRPDTPKTARGGHDYTGIILASEHTINKFVIGVKMPKRNQHTINKFVIGVKMPKRNH